MSKVVSDEGLNLLFRAARTHNVWLDKPVDDALLRQVYDLAKLGPTSANMCPMRVVFVKSKAGKEKLKPALDRGNVDKTMSAPVTAVIDPVRRSHCSTLSSLTKHSRRRSSTPNAVFMKSSARSSATYSGSGVVSGSAVGSFMV